MSVIDPYRGTVGRFKPDTSGNCPAALERAREKIERARLALNVIRWELVQIGECKVASAVARVLEELGHG